VEFHFEVFWREREADLAELVAKLLDERSPATCLVFDVRGLQAQGAGGLVKLAWSRLNDDVRLTVRCGAGDRDKREADRRRRVRIDIDGRRVGRIEPEFAQGAL